MDLNPAFRSPPSHTLLIADPYLQHAEPGPSLARFGSLSKAANIAFNSISKQNHYIPDPSSQPPPRPLRSAFSFVIWDFI